MEGEGEGAMNELKGKKIVQNIVDMWSKVYINQVFFKDVMGNVWCYEVEFSKPKNVKPIPQGTVKVYFTVMETADNGVDVEFNFENESLKHREGNTMRTAKYEAWIDFVLEKKLNIKTALHLGSEFEYTRFVDAQGQTVNPFVPKFDILKVKELDTQRKESQKINVDSPRFVTTLQRALEEMFQSIDKNGMGFLSYEEFKDAFRTLTYGLNDNDVNMLVALADEDKDEQISWKEFIPIGIEAIKTFYTRNIVKKSAQKMSHPDPDALKLVYWGEIMKTFKILKYRFEQCDTIEDGIISLQHFKNVIRDTKFITPKEQNLLIRLQRNDMIKYTEFPDMLYNVRYEIAVSEMMESRMNELEAKISMEFSRDDTDNSGEISVRQCEMALQRCKFLSLTPFQIHILIGLSDCDGDGMVPYRQFAKICHEYIDVEYNFDAMCKKQNVYKMIKTDDEIITHPSTEGLDILELFRTFKKYDRNMNGLLEFSEYTQCLSESPHLDLNKNEIVTLAMSADINNDGHIDFEEFTKHYVDFLNMIQFNNHLSENYQKFMEAEALKHKNEEEQKAKAELLVNGEQAAVEVK